MGNKCKVCKVEMDVLDTRHDPEGIRYDQKCPKCGRVYKITKALSVEIKGYNK